MTLRSNTLSQGDADLLARFTAGSWLYLEGPDLRRARRLKDRGMLKSGRLGDRYFQLSDAGLRFVEGKRQWSSCSK